MPRIPKSALESSAQPSARESDAMIVPDLLSPEARRARFDRLAESALVESHVQGLSGIGTLGEKRLHALIKHYLCDDEDCYEVGVLNTRFVSDVRVGNDVFEIQTGAFYPMKAKISHYLHNTDCTVTIVHPIPVNKWISWIDPRTGDLSRPKRSPLHGREIDLLPELYCLLPELPSPRLRFRLLLLDVQDFRLLDGWSRDRKRGSERYERLPLRLLDDVSFSAPSDFLRFLPDSLPSPFTVKTFSSLTKLRGRDAYSAVRVLSALSLLSPAPPIGRSMAFMKNEGDAMWGGGEPFS